ncbi:MAG: anti-sigma factor family protein [Planctomycetota bacterium]
MKCKKVKRKLSAYLDGELKEVENKIISEHLEKCINCKNEFTNLSNQDKFLKQLETIEPSVNFRSVFSKKLTSITSLKEDIQKIQGLSWFPLPAMSFLIFLIILNLSIFFFTLSVRGQDLRNQITSEVVKHLVIPSHLFNPVSLLNFCQSSCKILCKCAQNQGVYPKCICGKCNQRLQ